jgi:glyoxylase-like metal-dependent hydrolase (beta-lactamase superfamily II)
MFPLRGLLFDGFSRVLKAHLVCHCLLVETNRGWVLVDTSFGTRDIQSPYSPLSPFFIHFNGIQFDKKYTAVDRIQQLGFSPRDVCHIVLTHLDFDHTGGLEDFPEATVHVMQAQMDGAQHARGFIGRGRYRAQQWDEVKNWKFYAPGGEAWFGFEAVRDLEGLPPEILMMPLAGHTRGHAGIAIDTPQGWLLHAGDAYFYRDEMDAKARCTPGLRFYQWMMEVDRTTRLFNQNRLWALSIDRANNVRLFCSHDAVELKAFAESKGDRTDKSHPVESL